MLFGARAGYRGELPKADINKTLNKRVRQLPLASMISYLNAFKLEKGVKQTSLSEKHWRDACPYLPVLILGMNGGAKPDDGPLFEIVLPLDKLQAVLHGEKEEAIIS